LTSPRSKRKRDRAGPRQCQCRSGSTISGTLVGIGGISASGAGVRHCSQNITTSNVSSSQVGFRKELRPTLPARASRKTSRKTGRRRQKDEEDELKKKTPPHCHA
jgi:hypothetical protein